MGTAANTIARIATTLPAGRAAEDSVPVLGYGACYVSGCRCNSFDGNMSTCGYCGHAFSDHG